MVFVRYRICLFNIQLSDNAKVQTEALPNKCKISHCHDFYQHIWIHMIASCLYFKQAVPYQTSWVLCTYRASFFSMRHWNASCLAESCDIENSSCHLDWNCLIYWPYITTVYSWSNSNSFLSVIIIKVSLGEPLRPGPHWPTKPHISTQYTLAPTICAQVKIAYLLTWGCEK